MKNKITLALIMSIAPFISTTHASMVKISCESIFSQQLRYNQKPTRNSKVFLDERTRRQHEKIKTAWQISAMGAMELKGQLKDMENMLYYTMTAVLSQENIMVDGPGGAAKTLGLSSVFQAEIRSRNKLSAKDKLLLEQEKNAFKNELVRLILKDKKEKDPAKKVFTQQFHATLSESKVLGGPDLLKYVETGEYHIDYKKALISDENVLIILDELEKAPPALQMTTLSILNERQALFGNRIIQTAIESVASTTNATSSDFIAQALPHEMGGRRALLDRFVIKMHTDNVSIDGRDEFLLIRKVQASKKEKKFTIINLKELRQLVKQVEIPKEILDSMIDISLDLDRKYTAKLQAAVEEAEQGGGKHGPKYYPSFSGSNRVHAKVEPVWKAAFIVKQLLLGIDFDQKRMKMAPIDLLDLAPILIHGGPDSIVPARGFKVNFLLQSLKGKVNDDFSMGVIVSNKNKSANAVNKTVRDNLSTGIYDPQTQIFQYLSTDGELRNIYFNTKKSKLVFDDSQIRRELVLNEDSLGLTIVDDNLQPYLQVESRLAKLHQNFLAGKYKHATPEFKPSGRIDALINKNQSIRESSSKQLKEIREFQDHFISTVDFHIKNLAGKPLTAVDKNKYRLVQDGFKKKGELLRKEVTKSIQSRNLNKILDVSMKTVKNTYEELNWLFNGSGSNVRAMMVNIINKKNLMLFGPPGSAKTMMTRMVHAEELLSISDLQVAQMNTVLAGHLLNSKVTDGSLWVKQFHPMSTEGEIVGRLDLAELKKGKGYSYNRTGSLSAKEVYFALLDEYEKAPPGVKTALLSLMNERVLMDGDEIVASNIIAMILATNATPGEFIVGNGEFSTAFPIFDRTHNKAYSLNKLDYESLKVFHEKIHSQVKMKMYSPLMIHPLSNYAKKYIENIEDSELRLLTQIKNDFLDVAVARSDAEHRAFTGGNSDIMGDFYMNSRGESKRSGLSVFLEELSGAVLIQRAIEGERLSQIEKNNFSFDPKDIKAFAELLTTFNPIYEIKYRHDADKKILFYVDEKDIGSLMDRVDAREHRLFQTLKFEHDELVNIINKHVDSFLRNRAEAMAAYPNLFPSAFATKEARKAFLLNAGIKEEDIVENK